MHQYPLCFSILDRQPWVLQCKPHGRGSRWCSLLRLIAGRLLTPLHLPFHLVGHPWLLSRNDTRSYQHVSQRPSSEFTSFTKSSGLSGISEDSGIASASGISNLSDSLDYLSIGSVMSQMRSPGGPPSGKTKPSIVSGLRTLRRTLSPFPHQALQGLSPAPGKGLYSSPRRGKQRLSRCLPRFLRRKRPLRILPPWSRLGKWRLRTINPQLPR